MDGCRKSLRKRESGKNYGSVKAQLARLSKLKASPATPLVLRPRDAFAGSLLLTYSARRNAHARF
jgi:hypothetical protein